MFPGRDEGRRVGALHAAVGRVGVAVFKAEIGEPALTKGHPDVAGYGVRIPVAGAVGAGVELHTASLPSILELEVQYTGDGVRAVLGGGAVPQHFHLA